MTTAEQIADFYRENKGKYQLVLLCSSEPPQTKPGLSALAVGVLSQTIAAGGPADNLLRSIAAERPSRVAYVRWEISPLDFEVRRLVPVVWLPQVRLQRNGKCLMRSLVTMGEDGVLLTEHVSGNSVRRRLEDNSLQLAIESIVDRTPIQISR